MSKDPECSVSCGHLLRERDSADSDLLPLDDNSLPEWSEVERRTEASFDHCGHQLFRYGRSSNKMRNYYDNSAKCMEQMSLVPDMKTRRRSTRYAERKSLSRQTAVRTVHGSTCTQQDRSSLYSEQRKTMREMIRDSMAAHDITFGPACSSETSEVKLPHFNSSSDGRFLEPRSATFKELAIGRRKNAKIDDRKPWIFGAWGLFSSLYASLFGILLGGAGLLFSTRKPDAIPVLYHAAYQTATAHAIHLGMFVASLAILVATILSPCLHRAGPRAWCIVRPAILGIMALCFLPAIFTAIPALMFAFSAAMFAISAFCNERGGVVLFETPLYRQPWAIVRRWLPPNSSKKKTLGTQIRTWWTWHSARGAWARIAVKCIWALMNAALFASHYISAKKLVKSLATDPESKCYLYGVERPFAEACSMLQDCMLRYLPLAKGCGLCLDFNCALIILFVTQSTVKRMNDAVRSPRTSWLLGWFPVSRNLSFHKNLSVAIFIFTMGHAFGHFMSQSFVLVLVSRTLPFNGVINHVSEYWVMYSVWLSGGVLCLLLVLIYATASGPARELKYELFCYIHIGCAVSFFTILFWHAEVFLWIGGPPFLFYLLDLRLRSSAVNVEPVKLLEARYTHPVLQLVFATPWRFKSGQFCRIRCPWLPAGAEAEWHPFTISSAYESNSLSCHIKCHPGGWTELVRDCVLEVGRYAKKINWSQEIHDPQSDFYFTFSARDWITGRSVPGLQSWGDKPLFLVNGPHAAPAMHYDEFDTVLVVGSGIGSTPLNSIIAQVTTYSWRKAKRAKTTAVYAVWLCRHAELPAYRWFMESCSDCEVASNVAAMSTAASVHYEMHMFVTSLPDAIIMRNVPMPTPQPVDLHPGENSSLLTAQRPYTADELLGVMSTPRVPSSDFARVMHGVDKTANVMGHTHVWRGRPEWDGIFQRISDRHGEDKRRHRVGVFFCGAQNIVKDIKEASRKFTCSAISFHVMKEVF